MHCTSFLDTLKVAQLVKHSTPLYENLSFITVQTCLLALFVNYALRTVSNISVYTEK